MLVSHTMRQAAERIGLHRNTSFRWRQRFLALSRTDRAPLLYGIAEADEMFLLESQKDSRHLAQPACDRNGRTLNYVTGRGPLTKTALHQCQRPAFEPAILLVTNANTAYRAFAREAGISQEADISHEAVNLRADIRTRVALQQ